MNEKLCYIDNNFAYFTTQDLDKQWGDDWNDAPYEHNAGDPYEWNEGREVEKYEIIKVAFSGPLETPADIARINSTYSVQKINQGAVAWLTDSYGDSGVNILAGINVEKFTMSVLEAGGEVYFTYDQFLKIEAARNEQ